MARFCIGFAVAVYACYAFYLPIPVWWSLRFLFPAFPMFFILLVAGGFAVADRLPSGWRSVGVAVMVAAVTIHAMEFGRARTVFNADGELRYEIVGRYIREKTPAHAVFLTMLHSGSVRHYSGRLTVRYDWLMPEQFEPMVAHLRQRGYAPYLLLDEAEAEDFRRHFSGSPAVKHLNTPKVTSAEGQSVSPLSAGGSDQPPSRSRRLALGEGGRPASFLRDGQSSRGGTRRFVACSNA